jgi:hypothetical protein
MRTFSIYTVYNSPDDCPGLFVVRRFIVGLGPAPVNNGEARKAKTLEEARALIPPGLMCFPRDESDVPSVVETWF